MSSKEIGRVRISEPSRYIESNADEGDTVIRVSRHSSAELLRIKDPDEYWSSEYYCTLCRILISTSNDVFPLSMKLAFKLSGGIFMVLLVFFSLIIGLPLIYMETFFGRYARLTNCQIYRMAPIFFGVTFLIFSLNALYHPVHVTTDTQLLVSLLKLIANPNINDQCFEENPECYDYMVKGKVNDNCKYGYFSVVCERLGEIRYRMEYKYWRIYKDPKSPWYPYYQTIIAIVVTWILILIIVMKRIQVLGWVLHVAFIIHILTLTLIFALALGHDGSFKGLDVLASVDLKKLSFYEVLVVEWYSLCRLGLIIPTGHMTFSAYSKFKSRIATECLIAVGCSLALTGFYLAIFFALCGVIANSMGVDVETVFVPDRGLYLVIVPQFLSQLRMPNIFLIVYYGSLWFLETVKVALYVHLLILNLYDYFPTLKNFAAYIWVTSCLLMCFASIPICNENFQTVLVPALLAVYLTFGLGILITLEITLVSYFYGVSRVCDDIHFATGHEPVRFWRIMWYIIPLIGWHNFISMATLKEAYRDTQDILGQRTNEYGWLFAVLFFAAMGFLVIVSTVMYIAFRIGTPNLLLSLLKPQFFWGPARRQFRIHRKNFCPHSNIRSEQIYKRIEGITESVGGVCLGKTVMSQFSKDILFEEATRGDILNDKLFFERVGLYTPKEYCVTGESTAEVKEQELDIEVTT